MTDNIQCMTAFLAAVDQLEARAVAAEEELKNVKNQNENLVGQAEALSNDKKKLTEDLGSTRQKIAKRNSQLKLAQKQSRKDQKLLLLTKKHYFQIGYDEAVIKAHGLGFDHKLLLEDDVADPVGREEADVDPDVSFSSDEDLSE